MKENYIKYGITILVSFLIGGLVMYYVTTKVLQTGVVTDASGNTVTTCTACSGTVIVNEGSLSASVEKVYNSVVMVYNYKGETKQGTGSGFVYKQDKDYSYIMTNHHVVENGTKFEVYNTQGETVEATLLGSDEFLDLAVLKVKQTKNFPVAAMGDVNKLKLGDTIFAVGSPVGKDYFNSITSGIISGLNREVEVESYVMKVLQIDASVNPGNSGGPLVNAVGEVVGVISMKLVDNQIEGMGFAIPINEAMNYIDILESGKSIERPVLGVSMLDVASTNAWTLYRYGITLDSNIDSGVVVINVSDGAKEAGLKPGDVITKLGKDKVENSSQLRYSLYKYKVGDKVEITYYRDGKFNTCKVTLVKNTSK